ncbi:MAG: TonB-dependent receptor plug domain-containing protein, partial [Halioglobus sp.]|nr:TonB-dependent receptor plug domain-containing protein [Halioglobus sp.]
MFRRPLLAGIPLLTLLVLPPVLAQDQQPARERELLPLEEIIVTANRREQSLQEVPMSVSAFTGDFFKDAGVRDLAGLEQYTPSLKITSGTDSRSTSIRIRGIGSVGTNVGIDPSVGMFIDGVYQGRAGMSVADLIDIERVEVLRGPQGTLYGKNTAAGAISIITRKPSADLESELELTYNSDERLELRGMVNVPLGNGPHATRLTGFMINGDHLYENEADGRSLNDADKWGFKSRSLFDDSERLGELLVTVDYSKEDTDCCAVGVIDYNGFSTLNAPGTNRDTQALADQLGNNAQGEPIIVYESFEDSSGFSPPSADPFDSNEWVDADIFNKIAVGGIALEWNRDVLDDHVVTFINAWRHYEAESAYDGDFSAYNAVIGYQDIELDQYSSELRLTSPGGETWDYQAGLYYYHSDLDSIGTFEQSQELVQNMNIDVFFPE